MYSTCIYCHASLGRNEVIEQFPVGQRLAFDPARGRLWVVCRRCARWNLTPLEERWEAVEECERRFRGTRLRASTDNIGLARLREGLELVRVGRPARPELAAWRYVDTITRRRRRTLLVGAAGAAALVGTGYGLAAAGLGSGATIAWNAWRWVRGRRIIARIPTSTGLLPLRANSELHLKCYMDTAEAPFVLSIERLSVGRRAKKLEVLASVSGQEATLITARVLAHLNRRAGRTRQLDRALQLLDEVGDPFRSPSFAERSWQRWLERKYPTAPSIREGLMEDWHETGRPLSLGLLATEHRLALEMAANEETERRAIQGELAALEDAWRDAEEIAAIADDLLLPQAVRHILDRTGRGPGRPDTR